MSDLAARTAQFFQQPPQQVWLKASGVLPPWVVLILVALIAWQLARIVWLLVPADPPPPVTVPPAGSAGPAAMTGEGGANIDYIVNAHLFGRFDTSAPVLDLDPVDAPDTRLNLELRGTIAADEADQALAIIAERSREEKVYAVGDAVPGGASLHSVYTDKVLLRRAGQLETLRLPRASESGVSTAAPRRQGAAPSRASSIRDIVSQTPTKLTDVIRPQPVFRDGQQQGYRVYPGRDRQRFAALGLRPGDLITQINGMSLDDPARGMEIFRSLGDATQVSVTLERSGQSQVLNLDTSQLSGGDTSGTTRRARDRDRDEDD
ncbi:MAG: type II secretion system protein GspC [Gammaproteobacteria bacterium]